MYAGRDFHMVTPQESLVYTFDFRRDLNHGETIAGAAWTCALADDNQGADENPSGHLSGFPTNSGSRTSQRIQGLVDGRKYVLQAIIATSLGSTVSLWSHVACSASMGGAALASGSGSLMLESGGHLLLESGGHLLLE